MGWVFLPFHSRRWLPISEHAQSSPYLLELPFPLGSLPVLLSTSNSSFWSLLRGTHPPTWTHTQTHTLWALTCLLGLGFAGALGGLAPHGQSVLQQPHVSVLLPPGRANFHHAGALHHHTDVLIVQKPLRRRTSNTKQDMCKWLSLIWPHWRYTVKFRPFLQ